MKSKIARAALTVIATGAVMASVTTTAHAWNECTIAGTAGKWAFTDNGTVIGVGPRTAIGVFTLDNGQILNGKATSSLNGAVATEALLGSYTVNANCAGAGTATIYQSGTAVLDLKLKLAFDDDMSEMRAIFTSVTEPNGTVLPTVINLEARKQ
jgi:hypothetical protein